MMSARQLPWRLRVVRGWLFLVAALTFLIVVVGGATRATESGLSIVEWRPVTGTLPPSSEAEWQREFEQYQQIPQYRLANPGMKLAEFKTIYWWEWAHRLLGRAIGLVFLLPFLFFLGRGWIEPSLRPQLWFIFLLGALQGVVGWWMVSSGLVDRTEVSPYRLGAHLILACIIFGASLWTALGMAPRTTAPVAPRLRSTAVILVLMVFSQIYLGALLAGLRGGLIYNTWPLIDGTFVPPLSQLFEHPYWRDPFENILTVQFEHRMIAYTIWLVAAWNVLDTGRSIGFGPVFKSALLLLAAVTAQATLGIMTLLHQVPLPLALAHQAGAILVLGLALDHARRLFPAVNAPGTAQVVAPH